MNIIDIVRQLVSLSPRFAEGEEKTAQFIKSYLDKHAISYVDQEYKITVPVPKEVSLSVDGESIDCRNVGSESGTFNSKNELVSSLYWGENDFYLPQNINFNPQCKGTVSMAVYYKRAAIAIRRSDVKKVLESKEILGKTVVEPYSFVGHNFLIGNTKNPKNVIFTHYDCWESGAIDNASGTAVLMSMVVSNPEALKENLFVIAGTEEISYDEPIYWGKGYREFQKEYSEQLSKAKSIIVIDCVGYSDHEWVTDPEHVILGLPLDNFETFGSKSSMLSGDFEMLMEVYHSNDDTLDLLSEEKLQNAKTKLLEKLNSQI